MPLPIGAEPSINIDELTGSLRENAAWIDRKYGDGNNLLVRTELDGYSRDYAGDRERRRWVLEPLRARLEAARGSNYVREGDVIRGSIYVVTKDDVAKLAGATSVTGYLVIQGSQLKSADLAPLASLRTVGSLQVSMNTELEDLDALKGLQHAGDVLISGNRRLVRADLPALETVTTQLKIVDNALEKIDGFNRLRQSGGGVIVYGEEALKSIDGFASLARIGGDRIQQDPTFDGVLEIGRCPLLERVGAFRQLTSIGGSMRISENGRLGDLGGLRALRSIGGIAEVIANSSLRSLDALGALESVGANARVMNWAVFDWASWASTRGPTARAGKMIDQLGDLAFRPNWGSLKLSGAFSLAGLSSLRDVRGPMEISGPPANEIAALKLRLGHTPETTARELQRIKTSIPSQFR